MMIAQQLYEGVELPGEGSVGLITYMRTDSTRVVGAGADRSPRVHRAAVSAPSTCPRSRTSIKAKADAQDAHEAIRPTSMQYHPEEVRAHLTPDQYYLYKLIWNRFVASQMPPATFDETTVDINAAAYLVPRQGLRPEVRRLDGGLQPGRIAARRAANRRARARMRVTAEDEEGTGMLPPLSEGDRLELHELKPEQKFTQPPPRYSEATLVKALEENGIGRPSTYASIISVIQARDYVNKIEGRFKPTMLGHDARREAAQPGVRRHPRRRTTRASSRRTSTRSRKARTNYESTLVELLQEVREGLEARREGDDQPQGGCRTGSCRWRATSAASRW